VESQSGLDGSRLLYRMFYGLHVSYEIEPYSY